VRKWEEYQERNRATNPNQLTKTVQ